MDGGPTGGRQFLMLPHESPKWAQFEEIIQMTRRNPSEWLRRLNYGGRKHLPLLESSLVIFVCNQALEICALFPVGSPIYYLRRNDQEERIEFSQKQILCLLSHAFLDTLLPVNARLNLPNPITFQQFFIQSSREFPEKLDCILHYFNMCRKRIQADRLWRGTKVSFCRKRELNLDLPAWCSSDRPLAPMRVDQDGTIDDAQDALQADFANKYIGGGVLNRGLVQEEIKFLQCPECLVSMMLCEEMAPDEAILIRGVEQFTRSKGYGNETFECVGEALDVTRIDDEGFRNSVVVALDAIDYRRMANTDDQFTDAHMHRDLGKCLAALRPWTFEASDAPLRPFATGNWGCGAFAGDVQLKSMQQWAAASQAGREVIYFPFGEPRASGLPEVVRLLSEAGPGGTRVTVGALCTWLLEYRSSSAYKRQGVHEYLAACKAAADRAAVPQHLAPTAWKENWFECLLGFPEPATNPHPDVQSLVVLEPDPEEVGAKIMRSLVNKRKFHIGNFSTPNLTSLRRRGRDKINERAAASLRGRSGVVMHHLVIDDVLTLHEQYPGALFQVASQFNCLEMVNQFVTPEEGVTKYAHDATQGPACSIACGAGTIYRNYFHELRTSSGRDCRGQRADAQVDNLAEVGTLLRNDQSHYWRMQNGYTLSDDAEAMAALNVKIKGFGETLRDDVRCALRIGYQRHVGVTFGRQGPLFPKASGSDEMLVSQAFCSALSCGYSSVPLEHWEEVARIVLEATYEATLWAAVDNSFSGRGSTNQVFLTLVGGGAFGNKMDWIVGAIGRACAILAHAGADLEVVVCHYRARNEELAAGVQRSFESELEAIHRDQAHPLRDHQINKREEESPPPFPSPLSSMSIARSDVSPVEALLQGRSKVMVEGVDMTKLLLNIQAAQAQRSTHRLAFLVQGGSFCPIHKGHVISFQRARAELRKQGVEVVGGFLAVSSDEWVANKLKEEAVPLATRLHMCDLGCAGSDLVVPVPWGEASSARVQERLTKLVHGLLRGEGARDVADLQSVQRVQEEIIWIEGIQLCGSDVLCRRLFINEPIVVVPRDGDDIAAALQDRTARRIDTLVLSESSTNTFSSTRVRKLVAKRAWDELAQSQMLHDEVLVFLRRSLPALPPTSPDDVLRTVPLISTMGRTNPLLHRVIAFYFPGRNTLIDTACQAGWLGNFYMSDQSAPLGKNGPLMPFRCAESAYQALKFTKQKWVGNFLTMDGEEAYQAKVANAAVADLAYGGFGNYWHAMFSVLIEKYVEGSQLCKALLATGDAFLLEHNEAVGRDLLWSDNHQGDGANGLGLMLMLIRARLRNEGFQMPGVHFNPNAMSPLDDLRDNNAEWMSLVHEATAITLRAEKKLAPEPFSSHSHNHAVPHAGQGRGVNPVNDASPGAPARCQYLDKRTGCDNSMCINQHPPGWNAQTNPKGFPIRHNTSVPCRNVSKLGGCTDPRCAYQHPDCWDSFKNPTASNHKRF